MDYSLRNVEKYLKEIRLLFKLKPGFSEQYYPLALSLVYIKRVDGQAYRKYLGTQYDTVDDLRHNLFGRKLFDDVCHADIDADSISIYSHAAVATQKPEWATHFCNLVHKELEIRENESSHYHCWMGNDLKNAPMYRVNRGEQILFIKKDVPDEDPEFYICFLDDEKHNIVQKLI